MPVQQVQQQIQQQIPGTLQQGIPLQPNLVTQPMNMQQLHPVSLIIWWSFFQTLIYCTKII